MTKFKKTARSSLLSSAFATVCATAAVGNTVTLSTVDGSTSLQGEILDYDGSTYTLRTTSGDFVVRASETICDGDTCPALNAETTNLSIAGSGTITADLIPQLTEAYFGQISSSLERNDDMRGVTYFEIRREVGNDLLMTLLHTNSSMGFQDLVKGDLHAAFTTRSANEEEQLSATNAGMNPLRSEAQESVIAYDGLLVVTHPDNPVRAVSEMDIAKIYAGELSDWADLGREAGQINVYVREENSNSRDLLHDVLLHPNRKTLSANLIVLESDAEIAKAVSSDPDAIGLTSFVHRDAVNALEIEGVCGIRTPATEFTIKTGEYLLARPVYFYHNTEIAHEGVTGFAKFLSSRDGQSAIREAGFVDREIISKPLNAQGLRVSHTVMVNEALENIEGTRSMLELMSRSERLSTTVRFKNGSVDLDTTAYEDLEALAELIKSPAYEGSYFYFMGFSDSIGSADLNQLLALQRAEIVRQALVSRYPDLADRIGVRSVGFGELSPLACNETRPGRNVNRRVEVWVQDPMTTLAKN